MQLHKRFEAELVQRFLKELKEDERQALGEPPKIAVLFDNAPVKNVELSEKTNLLLSPAKPVLHLQLEGDGHLSALFFIEDIYIKAASRVGFTHLSFGFAIDRLGVIYRCQKR